MTREEAKDVFLNHGFIKVEGCRGRIFNGDKWRDSCIVISEWLKEEPILDKIRAEIEDTLYVDSLIFGELIDFKNGKISADDVIEEFNRVTRTEVLKIIDKYKAESEDI